MRERRRHERLEKRIRVIWRDRLLTVESITRDVCAGGAFIITHHVLPLRSEITLELYPEGEVFPIRCKATVAWVNRGQMETFPPGLGVEFLDMDSCLIERLLRSDEDEM